VTSYETFDWNGVSEFTESSDFTNTNTKLKLAQFGVWDRYCNARRCSCKNIIISSDNKNFQSGIIVIMDFILLHMLYVIDKATF
jgi:hypothetical protein